MDDNWRAADSYERYMGRWSRPVAHSFVSWLEAPGGACWLEVGCGTGALTRAICDLAAPASVLACDPSESFVSYAKATLVDPRISFVLADAEHPPKPQTPVDVVVSGLVLNFLPDPQRAIAAMGRGASRNALVAAYVWDYLQGMEFLRVFWDEASRLDPSAESLDEGRRFPLCRLDGLTTLFLQGGLREVKGSALQVATSFADFDDFWGPFLTGTGPAPSYVASLSQSHRDSLQERLSERLKADGNGSIAMKARAWAVVGRVSSR
jgi:SAM-dependent methyltransferase